jgi:hypothetical protein
MNDEHRRGGKDSCLLVGVATRSGSLVEKAVAMAVKQHNQMSM